jgi:hypothetical protein
VVATALEVNVIKLSRKAMPGCQRNVADSSMLRESHHNTPRNAVMLGAACA